MAAEQTPDSSIRNAGQTVCPQCGRMVDVSNVPPFTIVDCKFCRARFAAPGKIGECVLLGVLDHGEIGTVYRGFDTSMSRHVAVKVQLSNRQGSQFAFAQARQSQRLVDQRPLSPEQFEQWDAHLKRLQQRARLFRRGRGRFSRWLRDPKEMFRRFDTNKDGKLTKDEVPEPLWRRLSRADTDGDGAVTEDELETSRGPGHPGPPPEKRESTPAPE